MPREWQLRYGKIDMQLIPIFSVGGLVCLLIASIRFAHKQYKHAAAFFVLAVLLLGATAAILFDWNREMLRVNQMHRSTTPTN